MYQVVRDEGGCFGILIGLSAINGSRVSLSFVFTFSIIFLTDANFVMKAIDCKSRLGLIMLKTRMP
ncbi:MAG: hypothetical protein QG670_449 [Thermoproteota archaeon]|nr:hypothetical protein [Thermoproteota archaeon]